MDETNNFEDENLDASDINAFKNSCEIIINNSKRANSIVQNMLSLARGTDREKSTTNLKELIEEDYNLAYHAMRAKSPIDVENKLNFDFNEDFIGIRSDLSRALINIFENSFYSLERKLRTSYFNPQINVNLFKSEGEINIVIKDNGEGIPKEVQEKMFEPFYTTKPPGEGTGLGMSFVYDVAREHGGQIKIESKEREFTEITMTLKTT